MTDSHAASLNQTSNAVGVSATDDADFHLLPRTRQPRDPAAIGRAVVCASLVALLMERATAVANDLQLWGDGVWFLVRIASTQFYYFWVGNLRTDYYKSRVFTCLGLQTPVVLATHLRIHHLHVLSLIFGITLYSHALISLYLCYRYAPRRWYLLFPLLSLYAGVMNVEGYISTDSHFLVSLYWPILFILLFRQELSRRTLLLLVLLSIPTVLSYESMMFFGVILTGVCLWRMRVYPHHRALMAGLSVWYLIGVGMAIAAVIWPFDPGNRSGFIRGLLGLFETNHVAAKASVFVLLCCALLLAIPPRFKHVQTVLGGLGLAAVFYLCWEIFVGHAPTSLNEQVPARVLNLMTPLGVTVLLLAVRYHWFKPDRRTIAIFAIVVGSLGLGQVYWALAYISQWQGMLATLRYELLLHEGPIPFDSSVLSRQKLGTLHLAYLHATWPLLPLSIYESEGGQVRSIAMSQPNNYQPFDAYSAAGLPDLSRYGVNYSVYLDALRRNWTYTFGQSLNFSQNGSAYRFLRGGWSTPEAWATWTEQPDFGLVLPLADHVDGDAILSATMAPNLSPGFSHLTMDISVNDVPIGTWPFNYRPGFHPETKQIRIPKDVLLRASPLNIRFHIREPLKSPTEQGKGHDDRKLGVAFVSMRLDPTP